MKNDCLENSFHRLCPSLIYIYLVLEKSLKDEILTLIIPNSSNLKGLRVEYVSNCQGEAKHLLKGRL